MTIVTVKNVTNYTLNPADPTLTFSAATNIDGTKKYSGVYGNANVDWSLTNLGSISGSSALALLGNATLVNDGKISNVANIYSCVYIGKTGHVTNNGSIIGSGTGGGGPNGGISAIYIHGGGTIVNSAHGAIVGNVDINGFGTITNAGSIANSGLHFADIGLNSGGTVTNSGTLKTTGQYASGIYAAASALVTNSGTISASSTNFHSSGINLHNGGTATNTGTIVVAGEHGSGVELGNGGTAINSGKINGSAEYVTGIVSTVGGSITNSGSITLSSAMHISGIALKDGGTAKNTGTITVTVSTGHAAGVELDAGGTFTNSGHIVVSAASYGSGVDLANGGTLQNLTGGLINAFGDPSGNAAVYAGGTTGVSITNAGTISGKSSIFLANAGTGSAAIINTVTLESGSHLLGEADGSTGAFVTNNLIFEGSGTASNIFTNFQNLTVNTGAAWLLTAAAGIANTIVEGKLTVSATGSLSGALTLEGGTAIFKSAYDEAVTFQGKGELELSAADTGMISGFGLNDKIDLLNLTYSTGDKASVLGDVLTIGTTASHETFILNNTSYTSLNFTLGKDATGHVLVSYK